MSRPVEVLRSDSVDLETDIVVIGGGISGLYCAHQLATRGMQVHLLESSTTRFGGRIETTELKGHGGESFQAEFGPMRFEIKLQPRFAALCELYGITFASFPPPTPADWTVDFGLPSKLCDPDSGEELNPLQLLRLGVFKMFGCKTEIRKGGKVHLVGADADWLKNLDAEGFERLRLEALSPKGRPLYEMGFIELVEDILGNPAVKKIMSESTFYDLIAKNPNAVEWGIFWLRYFQLADGEMIETIPNGVETIITSMVDAIGQLDRVTLHLGTTATSVSPEDGTVIVDAAKHDGMIRFRARHVIFALPQQPLIQLGMDFPVDVQAALTRVIPIHLAKVIAVMTTPPWWKPELPQPQQFAHVVPSREIHYFAHGEEETVVMIYTDEPNTKFWGAYVDSADHRQTEINVNAELKIQLSRVIRDVHVQWANQRLRKSDSEDDAQLLSPSDPRTRVVVQAFLDILNEHTINGELGGYSDLEALVPTEGEQSERLDLCAMMIIVESEEDKWLREMVWQSIADYGIRDWSHEPFGAGVHLWSPGARSWEIRKLFAAFGFAGYDGRENLHICGEAFSEYQGFIEGALSSADAALATIS